MICLMSSISLDITKKDGRNSTKEVLARREYVSVGQHREKLLCLLALRQRLSKMLEVSL